MKHILLLILLTAGVTARSGEPFRGYSDSLYLATYDSIRSFDMDGLMRDYVSKGRAAVADRIYYLYYIFFREVGREELEKGINSMEEAAKAYKSGELALEAEFFRATFLPQDTTGRNGIASGLEKLGRKAMRRGDDYIRLKAMEKVRHYSGYETQAGFGQGYVLLDELFKADANVYPEKYYMLFTVAEHYYSFRDYDRAVPILKSLVRDSTRMFFDNSNIRAMNTLGIYYSSVEEDPELSDHYFRSILASGDNVMQRPIYQYIAAANLARNRMKRGEYREAAGELAEAMPGILRWNDPGFAAGIAASLVKCHLETGDLGKAGEMIDSARVYIGASGLTTRYKDLYPLISRYHALCGNVALSQAYADSALVALRKYEQEHSTMRILRGEQELFEARTEEQRAVIRSQRRTIFFILLITLLMAASLSVILWLYRKKQAAYRALALKTQHWAGVASAPADYDDREPKEDNGAQPTPEDLAIFEKAGMLMGDEHVYRNPDLTLDLLAQMLGVNRQYLSQAINRSTGKGFSAYVNEYRVKEAVRILSDDRGKRLSLEGVAFDVGFSQRKSFYSAFKKLTGLSPSDYRNNLAVEQ